MSTYLVIANKDNAVLEVFVCESAEAMEARFTEECEAFGVSPVEEHFDDGYIELEEGVTLCMVHARNNKSMFRVEVNFDNDGIYVETVEANTVDEAVKMVFDNSVSIGGYDPNDFIGLMAHLPVAPEHERTY